MEIDINQKEISIGDKYRIFIDGHPAYTATQKLFRFLPQINLFAENEVVPRMVVKRRFSWLLAKYDITRGWTAVFYNFGPNHSGNFTTNAIPVPTRTKFMGIVAESTLFIKMEIRLPGGTKKPGHGFQETNIKLLQTRIVIPI